MDPGRLPLIIGVIGEHLLWRIVVLVVSANALGVMVKWAISKGATRTISAHLSKSFGKGASSWGHSRIDLRDHGTVDARSLEGNRTMWSAVFIVVEDRTHRSAVTLVIAAVQERVHLVRGCILRDIVVGIVIGRGRAIAISHCSQHH